MVYVGCASFTVCGVCRGTLGIFKEDDCASLVESLIMLTNHWCQAVFNWNLFNFLRSGVLRFIESNLPEKNIIVMLILPLTRGVKSYKLLCDNAQL